jgi:glycosyltransferase involved in cell wall biosynthesis
MLNFKSASVKVSIALCTYNGEKFLKAQIDSYLRQTYLPDELIVCDDNSQDNTVALLEELKKTAPFHVSIFRNKSNLGVIRNFEKAIEMCSGDIIFLSDQDDIWRNDKIEICLENFENHHGSLMVFSNGDLIDESGELLNSTLWEEWKFSPEVRRLWSDNNKAFDSLIRNDNKITGATAAIRSDLKKHIFPFNVPKGFWHDSWLGIYASKEGGLFYIEDSLIQYRVHKEQLVGLGNGTALKPHKETFRNKIASKIFKKL